jgi:hypothetical protein
MNPDPPSQMHESLVENFFLNQDRGVQKTILSTRNPSYSHLFLRKKSERGSEEDCKRLMRVLQCAPNAVFSLTLASVLHSCSVYKISFSRLNC